MVAEGIKDIVDDIPKSVRDDRYYRGLVLENKMKVLLISDPRTDKSAAAMDVHIGSMSDPEKLPGLAHFCEHMLFLGTEKYPLENAFTQFLSENGGSSNAFTGSEHTNYYFDVKPEQLEEALDRFAQFFLTPMFNADAKDREVNAVDSEHEKNKNTDIWRFNQLEKSTLDPAHPYSKFGTGNRFTLDTKPKEMNIDVREELLKFHSGFYSSNIMGLAVLGKESLDQLTELITKLFARVKDKNVNIPEFPVHPYQEENLQVQLKTVPVRDLRNLNMSFPLPDISRHFDSKPSHYVSHLIGHEAEGSLLSELKAKGWANGLVAGAVDGAKGFMFFICNIELTVEGLSHTNEIVKCVFQYLHMLREQEPLEWVYDECRALAEIKFNFKDKESPRGLVSAMARSLHDYPLPEVMRGQYLMTCFKPDLIKMVINHLIASKVRIMVISKEFQGKTNKTEPWYGTEYSLEKIPEAQIQEWSNVTLNPALSIPEKNEFIPTDFEIKGKHQEMPSVPKLIKDTSLSKVWFKQDDTFLLPKACLFFEITSPLAYIDPCHCNMAHLFVEMLQDSLNEYAYDAEIAGVSYKLKNTMYGMFLDVKGYNHKQRILLQKILKRMTKFVVNPKRFPLIKERYQRGLKNFKAEQPHRHALYYTSFLMEEVCWHKNELLEALDEVTVDKLQAFIPELLGRLHIESLLQGNLTEEEALKTMEMMEGILKDNAATKPLVPLQLRRHREIQLPPGSSYVFETQNEVHSNSSLEIYYQTELQSTRSNMLLELFCQVISEPCFNTLRTQEQLGYIVFSGPRRGNGAQGLRFLVQSEKTPSLVDTRVEAFLVKMEEYVTNMAEEEFKNHVEALAVKRLEKPKKLVSECMKHWGEIISRQYNFDRDNIEVAFLRKLTKDDLLEFFESLLAADAPRRHKLAVHILAKDMTNEKLSKSSKENEDAVVPPTTETTLETQNTLRHFPIHISDVTAFKSSLPLFPLVAPWDSSQSTKSKL